MDIIGPFLAFGIAVFFLVRHFRRASGNDGECSGECSGCHLNRTNSRNES